MKQVFVIVVVEVEELVDVDVVFVIAVVEVEELVDVEVVVLVFERLCVGWLTSI